ncbi:MAG: Na(+)-translocating NADH-quinone reductase subunit C [Lysobacterales bacterium]|jgi:Na+-transporting NADH:ubiquinone oxidoreductase subunit C
MSNDSSIKAVLVVLITAIVCSSLVSAAVVVLRPVQLNNQLLDRSRNIMSITGLMPTDSVPEDDEILELFKSLDARVVDLEKGRFDDSFDPWTFDQRRAVADPELGVAVPAELDIAQLSRRSRYAVIYLVWNGDELDRIVLPVRGAGMWSMLYGYIAMKPDLVTIAGMAFYEQNETPGLGDQITHPHWLERWTGKQVYDDVGVSRFRVAEGEVDPNSVHAPFQVDGITGATVTGNAVTALINYWFGPHGYKTFFDNLKNNPPTRDEG